MCLGDTEVRFKPPELCLGSLLFAFLSVVAGAGVVYELEAAFH